MSRYEYSEEEQIINAVLAYQDKLLNEIGLPDTKGLEETIASSESLLRSLGYNPAQPADMGVEQLDPLSVPPELISPKRIYLPSWDELVAEACENGCADATLEDLFTPEELDDNAEAVRRLNAEYNAIHQLDEIDVAIAAGAGLLSAAIEILLVGIPRKTPNGVEAGPVTNFIRGHLEHSLSPSQLRELERAAEVPYDATVNEGYTTTRVEGLCPGMHRLYSLGHDPLLGLVVGVSDILTGRMTTIDKHGKIVVQAIERYAHLRKTDVVQALVTQLMHFFSDVTTPAGLPAPGMTLFNLMQFGSIGDEKATIAEIVQGMYWQGYDFVQFCSQSIPVAVCEILVRFAYAFRKVKGGTPVKDAIPLSTNREKNPKLGTMLFTAHSIATAANAGVVAFSKNPMAVSYPQWIAFAKHSYQQLRWVFVEKPAARDRYVRLEIAEQLQDVYGDIDDLFERVAADSIVLG